MQQRLPFLSLVVISLSLLGVLAKEDSCCNFASEFSDDDLLKSSATRRDFMKKAIAWEGRFHELGFNQVNGMSYDGFVFDFTTGLPVPGGLHNFSAASKESLHLNMLALCLQGNHFAKWFVSPNNIADAVQQSVDILKKKMDSYQMFLQTFPGFGGFLPWYFVNDTTIVPTPGFAHSVPGLDNGQFAWALNFVARVLKEQGFKSLGVEYSNYVNMLKENAFTIFYDGDGLIRAVTEIENVFAPVSENNYTCTFPCGYLNDPYEGELMAWWLDLYHNWTDQNERERIWINKRPNLQAVNYSLPDGSHITVQRGFWFSAHEQWKALVLPYYSVNITKRVLMNCERARTAHSYFNKIPGLYASVNDVFMEGLNPPDYISAAGIQSIASQIIQRTDVITPYGAFPLMLADLPTGLVWYKTMISTQKMQSPFGTVEASAINGSLVSHMGTWDSKVTSVVAMLGGMEYLATELLTEEGLWDRFETVLTREYSRVFQHLAGEDQPFFLPSVQLPDLLPPYTNCTC